MKLHFYAFVGLTTALPDAIALVADGETVEPALQG